MGENLCDFLVTVDGQPIGLIQKITVEANAKEIMPKVEIIFPDLRGHEFGLKDTLIDSIQALSEFPYVTLVFEPLSGKASKASVVNPKAEPVALWEASEMPEDPKDLIDPRDL